MSRAGRVGRWALSACALALGLVLALALQGRVAHVRLLAPQVLPGWTERLTPQAGLLSGQMALAGGGAVLDWQAAPPRLAGPVWRVRISGAATDLAGTLTANWRGDRLVLADLTGSVGLADLAELAELADGPWRALGGSLVPQQTALALDRSAEPARWTATATAQWRDAGFDGTALGEGPVGLRLDPLGSWRLTVQLAGGVAPVSAEAVGRVPSRAIGLTLEIARTEALPAPWRNALQLTGAETETGWRIDQRLDLP